MFYRKISKQILSYFADINSPILLIDGARQIGKTFIIKEIGKERYKNFIEINIADDLENESFYSNLNSADEFYFRLSSKYGNKLGNINDTLIFIDEIQFNPKLLSMLKKLRIDNKYKYICSGSQLGITLKESNLSPAGYVEHLRMYPMDFEEFLLANGFNCDAIDHLRNLYENNTALDEVMHTHLLTLFKKYLIVGGLPASVSEFVYKNNVFSIRKVHNQISKFYSADVSQYDELNKLKIKRIYELMSSNIENKVKRIQIKDVDNKKGSKYKFYSDEFEYILASGIGLGCYAISEPKFPLIQSSTKNLIKLYYNDVGLLTNMLYKTNIDILINKESALNLGAVYETVVAQELVAHGYNLFYFDRRKLGEVDFLIDNYVDLYPQPIEVKSGKDSCNYRAMPKMILEEKYHIKKGIVLSNNREVFFKNNILHLPIYFIMFI